MILKKLPAKNFQTLRPENKNSIFGPKNQQIRAKIKREIKVEIIPEIAP